ncbi:MAG: beta-ketoacyl-ACP synthase II [Deltaproteobacteria bacterium]|nr:beta-ketoacyl-ACP synthase II [Deltaproteobacteria bacterium]
MDVVVTGLGVLAPFGRGAERTFEALVAGRSAVGRITRFDASEQRSRIAAEVRELEAGADLSAADLRTYDRFQLFALLAALDAVRDAGLGDGPLGDRAAVVLGAGIGGLETIERNHEALREKGPRRVSPYFIPSAIPNLAASLVAMRVGALGACISPASACASGAHAIGEALWALRAGRADLVLAGGTEAAVTPLGVAGFGAMRALSERNDDPARASRPFDRGRDGFVIGEGAGVLVLETAAHAAARGARVRARLAGYGATADAHHITQPDPEAAGMARAMARALEDARVSPADVGYVNAHATSTPLGDRLEAKAIRDLFGDRPPPVSSTKSALGHLLGAAGAVEAAIAVLALERGLLPPTLNQEDPDPQIELDVVPNEARPAGLRYALSNAFGFGGTNATLLFAGS